MSEKSKPKKTPLVPKTTKKQLVAKKSKEEELYASMAECLEVIPAEKPDPANLNILKGKRPNIREIAWYWLPANQENLSEPGHCRTFTIPEATEEELTASDLSISNTLLQDAYEITEPSTSAELLSTGTESDISSSLLSSDFASLSVSNKTSSDEISYKSSTDDKTANKMPSSSESSSKSVKDNTMKTKKTRFKNLPSIEKSIDSGTVEENVGENIPIPSSGKFINTKPDETGNYKLDKFTHGFYELLGVEGGQACSANYSFNVSNNMEQQANSETDISSSSCITNTPSTTESFHLIDPIPLHSPASLILERSPEKVPFACSATPALESPKQEINFNVDLISARSNDEKPEETELTPRDDELYVSGNYSIYPITELTEPSSCNSDFEEPLVGFDEFHQKNPRKQPKNTAWDIDITSENKSLEHATESEFETADENSESDNDNDKLRMFNMQEIEKLPSNKIGVRFKRILKVNGKHIFDCKCNYHLLPVRYQKKYRNPECLLLEFNHLLLPSDKIIYFSSHYCPYTIQEMNDIMEITGGLKYLPKSYIMHYILYNKFQRPLKKSRMRTTPYLDTKEMVVSLVERSSNMQVNKPVQAETSTSEDPLNSPVVLPPLAERQANRSKRPTTRRWDSEVKRPE